MKRTKGRLAFDILAILTLVIFALFALLITIGAVAIPKYPE